MSVISGKQDEIDALVDIFVAKVNSGQREPIVIDIYETPASVLEGEPDEFFNSDWAVKPYNGVDWVEPLEKRLGCSLPAAYKSLVSRYIFPGFEAGGILFFGNTPEGTEYYELRERIFKDRLLFDALSSNGFIQFGTADWVNYDPVCFDYNRRSVSDCPVVRIDHEGVLCSDVVRVVEQIASSFRDFLESVVGSP